jgi:hypothetical protein
MKGGNKMEDEVENLENMQKTERNPKEIAVFNRQITTEKNKLIKIFSKCDDNIKKIANPLIENASYMKVELSYLKKYNIKNGNKEFYMNGKGQFGFKESVESKTYNTMMKNYMSVIKQLNEMLPKGENIPPDDGFEDF